MPSSRRTPDARLAALVLSFLAPAAFAADASGHFRYHQNRLAVSAGCAFALPATAERAAATLIVLSDRPFDCAAAARTDDPGEALDRAAIETDQGRVEIELGADGKLARIHFGTWKPLDSLTIQGRGEVRLESSGSRAKGSASSGGELAGFGRDGDRTVEFELAFDLPLTSASGR